MQDGAAGMVGAKVMLPMARWSLGNIVKYRSLSGTRLQAICNSPTANSIFDGRFAKKTELQN
jgi:hypothetical protein